MQTGYFSAAWNDVKSSQGWLGKMFLLGLIAFIPVFGPVVLLGYAFGWARDIAWGVHMPMPARIFGNEDGLLYRRGLIVLVICVVCCVVIPGALEGCWDALAGRGLSNVSHAVWGGAGGAAIVSPVYSLFSLAVFLASVMFFLVASMRASIYGRLGPGFQIPRLWAMMRHDMKGLLRVLGFSIVLAIVPAVVTGIVGSLLVGGFISVGAYGLFSNGTAPDMMFVLAAGLCLVVICLALAVVVSAASAFAVVMQARAVGYWTRQFDVPAWRGQDDPMPFEMASNGALR